MTVSHGEAECILANSGIFTPSGESTKGRSESRTICDDGNSGAHCAFNVCPFICEYASFRARGALFYRSDRTRGKRNVYVRTSICGGGVVNWWIHRHHHVVGGGVAGIIGHGEAEGVLTYCGI